jgi:hypothetical protein
MLRSRARRKDPPTASQLARERALQSHVPAREQIAAKLAEMGRLAASMVAPPSAPPPPRVPRPPGPPPQARPLINATTSPATRRAILQAQANVAAGSAPCLLSAEQLALGMPSEQTLRFMRAARDKYEAEAKQRERDRLHALR